VEQKRKNMKQIFLSTAILASMASGLYAQNANVQIIHNCADPLADSVDVYINGAPTIDNFAFRTATGQLSLPAGTYVVDIAPKTSTSVAQSIFTDTLMLMASTNYTVIANGLLSGPVNTAFNLYAYANSRTSSAVAGNTDLLVFHGATDAPTVDVTVAGGSPTLSNDLAYATYNSGGYIELPTADYSIEVRDASGAVVVAGYEAPLAALSLTNSAITVVASGFLAPQPGQAAFGLYVALPTGGNLVPLPTSNSLVQIIHNSSDVAADSVDIYLDGAILLDNFAFRTATPFVNVTSGVAHTIAVAPKTSTSASQALATFPVTFAANEVYVVVANGLLAGPVQTQFNLYTYAMGRTTASNSSNSDVLIFHGSTDAPTVDVTVAGGNPTLANDLAYATFNTAGYLELPTANYQIDVRDQTGATVVATYDVPLQTLNLAGAAMTVVASGFLAPAPGQPAFGLYVALTAGGNLVPLPLSNTSGIAEENTSTFRAYPNPVQDELIIDQNGAVADAIEIVDVAGRVVYSQNNISESVVRINTASFANGIYTVRVISGATVSQQRIVVGNN
jgi:hypothetical protein